MVTVEMTPDSNEWDILQAIVSITGAAKTLNIDDNILHILLFASREILKLLSEEAGDGPTNST